MKDRVQVLFFNRERKVIRKIVVDRNAQLNSEWMRAIDKEATYFEKTSDF